MQGTSKSCYSDVVCVCVSLLRNILKFWLLVFLFYFLHQHLNVNWMIALRFVSLIEKECVQDLFDA